MLVPVPKRIILIIVVLVLAGYPPASYACNPVEAPIETPNIAVSGGSTVNGTSVAVEDPTTGVLYVSPPLERRAPMQQAPRSTGKWTVTYTSIELEDRQADDEYWELNS